MKFDASKLKNGTVLLIGVSYNGSRQPGGDQRGMARPVVYTYGLLKAGGKWYMTGMGDVPQAAGWLAIERWLGKQDRKLEWVKGTHEEAMAELWSAEEPAPAAAELDSGRRYVDADDPHPEA